MPNQTKSKKSNSKKSNQSDSQKLSYSKIVSKSKQSSNVVDKPSTSFDDGNSKSKASKSDENAFDSKCKGDKRKTGSLIAVQYFDGGPADQTVKAVLHCHRIEDNPSDGTAELTNLMLITRVPVSMSFQELLMFIGPVSSNVKRMRLIRDGTPNQYLALLKFKDEPSSNEFYTHFDQVPFNSIEGDICNLVFVDAIECASEHRVKNRCSNCEPSPATKLLCLPSDALCPVCLEPTDESAEAPITILCNHSFHLTCLLKWGDHSCPICRYVPEFEHDANSACTECDEMSAQDSLWLCITCGHIGCGRYSAGHAYQHYKQTSHNFVKLVGHSNKVWDYAADNYVHRLLQNDNDGKPVELAGQLDEVAEKIDAIQLEYTYLMTNQLDSQRTHYERLLDESNKQLDDYKSKASASDEQIERLQTRQNELSKENERFKKRITTLEEKLKTSDSALKEEKEMNKILRDKIVWIQNHTQTRIGKAEDDNRKLQLRLVSLEEQIKDFQFFNETQRILRSELTEDELAESQVIVTEKPIEHVPSGRNRRKNN